MKPIVYYDQDGYLRRVLVRDEDGEEMAEFGIPAGPPDIEGIDWDTIKRETNNLLVREQAFTYIDVQRTRSLEKLANIFKRHVVAFLKERRILLCIN